MTTTRTGQLGAKNNQHRKAHMNYTDRLTDGSHAAAADDDRAIKIGNFNEEQSARNFFSPSSQACIIPLSFCAAAEQCLFALLKYLPVVVRLLKMAAATQWQLQGSRSRSLSSLPSSPPSGKSIFCCHFRGRKEGRKEAENCHQILS
jgi:hypothetical protein